MNGQTESSNATRIAQLIKERVPQYYADTCGKQAVVRLVGASQRPFSELYEFTINAGGTRHAVFAKVPFLEKSRPALDRPRLFPPVVPAQMASLEYTALHKVDESFSRLGDPRFGTVRVLDLLTRPETIVMEKVDGISLRAFRRKAPAFNSSQHDLGDIFHNVGVWLSHFHQLPRIAHTSERTTTRDDYLTTTAKMVEYLALHDAPRWLGAFGTRLLREAEATLPAALPLGLAHGDFAPRNVILTPGNRITVLDTLARWRAPIYEDIAVFLLSLQLTSGIGALRPLDSCERCDYSRAFLSGYFSDSGNDWPIVRLFLYQALLDRWCSYASQRRVGSPFACIKREFKLQLLQRLAKSSLSSARHGYAFVSPT